MVITPAQPDNLGGTTYTFGITDLSGASVDYNLVSDLCFEPIAFPVQSAQVQLVADTGSGLTYYLAIYDGTSPTPAATVVVQGLGPSLPAQHIFFARAGGGGRHSGWRHRCLADSAAPAIGPALPAGRSRASDKGVLPRRAAYIYRARGSRGPALRLAASLPG